MLSNKLTFSLASLVLLLGIAFVAIPPNANAAVTNLEFAVDTTISVDDAKHGFLIVPQEAATAATTGIPAAIFTGGFPTVTIPAAVGDLDLFFQNGGTIRLLGPAGSEGQLVISEIMWGMDASQTTATTSQWIELYNTTGADLTLAQEAATTSTDAAPKFYRYTLQFIPAGDTVGATDHPNVYDSATGTTVLDRAAATNPETDTGYVVVDEMGNDPGYWEVAGQSGRSVADTTNGIPAKAIISMYRDINYEDIAAEYAKDTIADNITEIVASKIKNGTRASGWKASERPSVNIPGLRIATPLAPRSKRVTFTPTTVPATPFIINEVGNAAGSDMDWVELKNVSDAEASLKNYTLSIVDATNTTGKELVSFKDKDYKVPAGGVFLIVNKDPIDTDLASGVNVAQAEADRNKFGSPALFSIDNGLAVPNEKSLLVLRNTADARNNTNDAWKNIIDIAGNYYGELNNANWNTALYPLQASEAGNGNVFKDLPEDMGFADGKVYQRDAAKAGTAENAFSKAGFTGIGWDRSSTQDDAHGGTPGFANDSQKESGLGMAVTISEVMVNSGNGRYPQWIELRNSSKTLGVNLNTWMLRVENVGTDMDTRQSFTLDLPDGYQIPPNQTILIVARTGPKSDNIQSERVINLARPDTKKILEVTGNKFTMLSMEGFSLKLFEKDQDPKMDEPVDMVMVSPDQLTEDKIGSARERISLIRVYMDGSPGNLISAANSEQAFTLAGTYYGSSDDIGTPGNYPGGILPVSLSSFRPMRDKATGEVVIRWITQSELNNAGFNILRSETKTGEFKVVNTKGIIPGHGTTSEKHVYTWTDTSAKPNVVYYYQIEDVSLDGKRTTLRTTHLRGNVNAAGKVTTTWGDLKTQN